MKILILALSGIGDALMFTPSVRLLRETYPEARIDVMAMFKGVADMYRNNGNINSVLYFDFMKQGALKSLLYLLRFRGNYDVTINVYPANRKEYNIFSFLLGAKKRAAVDYLRKNRSSLAFLNNIRIKENDSLHNVEENIRLCEKLTGKTFTEKPSLDFPISADDEAYAEASFQKLNCSGDDLIIGFHPGSATLKNHIHRRWEPEKFALLGKELIEKYGAKVFLFGGPEESELKAGILKQINSENAYFIETENLPQSAALMKRCSLFISNDSSLMHVASAMKLNVVAIIGPTNINYIHPWQTEHRIVSLNLECSPCFFYSPVPLICFRNDVKFKCIKELTVEMVFNAARQFIGNPKN